MLYMELLIRQLVIGETLSTVELHKEVYTIILI